MRKHTSSTTRPGSAPAVAGAPRPHYAIPLLRRLWTTAPDWARPGRLLGAWLPFWPAALASWPLTSPIGHALRGVGILVSLDPRLATGPLWLLGALVSLGVLVRGPGTPYRAGRCPARRAVLDLAIRRWGPAMGLAALSLCLWPLDLWAPNVRGALESPLPLLLWAYSPLAALWAGVARTVTRPAVLVMATCDRSWGVGSAQDTIFKTSRAVRRLVPGSGPLLGLCALAFYAGALWAARLPNLLGPMAVGLVAATGLLVIDALERLIWMQARENGAADIAPPKRGR